MNRAPVAAEGNTNIAAGAIPDKQNNCINASLWNLLVLYIGLIKLLPFSIQELSGEGLLSDDACYTWTSEQESITIIKPGYDII